MHCPKCHGLTHVLESRLNKENRVRRRRECLNCKERFASIEIAIKLGQRVKKPNKSTRNK